MTTVMVKRRKRDEKLAYDVGKRLSTLIKDKKAVAAAVGVSPSTIWDYMNGDILPGMEVLLKIATYFGVTTDWLLRGEGSPMPKNAAERMRLEKLRRAEAYGIAEDIDRYAEFLIAQKQHALPGMEEHERIIYPAGLDSLGQRLRWFRKAVAQESPEVFADSLGVSTATLERFESGREVPDATFLSRLNAKFHDRVDLDWLISGTKKENPTDVDDPVKSKA